MTDSEYFQFKKINFDKLIEYGFSLKGKEYLYTKDIQKGNFKFEICITAPQKLETKVYDNATNEEYLLYKASAATGSFVVSLRLECQKILDDIALNCCSEEIFKSAQAKAIIDYVKVKYGDQLEYLWKKSPTNAILRRKDNQKWYLIIMVIPLKKLSINSSKLAEIIDIRIKEENQSLIDKMKFYPAWHMNKKHWCTIILNESVATTDIFNLIDESYQLAKK